MVQNKRHGQGRMEYKCGDVYEGQFRKDRRHGMGSHYYANGDCFVGYYCADRREGLGTIYWLSRAKKYEVGPWIVGLVCPLSPASINRPAHRLGCKLYLRRVCG